MKLVRTTLFLALFTFHVSINLADRAYRRCLGR